MANNHNQHHIGESNKMITAVEWLYKKLQSECLIDMADELFYQAKAMEKEQMIDMWIDGNNTFIFNGSAEQYYEETYEKR